MPGIDSSWTAEVAGSGATAEVAGGGASADVLAGALDVLSGERDEHPAAALTKTEPIAIAIRTECVDGNDMRSSSRIWTDPQSRHSRCGDVPPQRSGPGLAQTDDSALGYYTYFLDDAQCLTNL
jgi:hypothetical protein